MARFYSATNSEEEKGIEGGLEKRLRLFLP